MLGLASSEGLGRTATSGMNFMRLMLPQPRKIEKEMRAFFRRLVDSRRPPDKRSDAMASASDCLKWQFVLQRTLPENTASRERRRT